MIPYDKLTEDQFDDLGYFGHKLTKKETGVDIDIWVTVKPFWDDISVPYLQVFGYIDEWIKVDTPYVEISIEDEPKIISEMNHKISDEQFKQVSDWIKLNEDCLIKQWTLEYSTMEFNRNRIKLGE